jgi:N6-adenosine-specific RNA methylase IME4
VLDHGSPKLREALKRSIIPASLASVITKLAPEEQDRIVEQCIERGDPQLARDVVAEVERSAKRQKEVAADRAPMDRPRFAVVLAEPWGPVSGDLEHHQPVLSLDTIKALGRNLVKHLQPSAVLFLRAPAPRVAQALDLVNDLGFEYIAQMVCSKAGAGSDDFVRYDHELLLIGARGDKLLPNPADRPSSVTRDKDYLIIERMYPELPKLALFVQMERTGWTAWDNGAPKPIRPSEDVNLD